MALTKAMLDELVGDCKTPQEMEKLVTIQLEKQLNDVEGIKEVRSTSAENVASIVIEFMAGEDIEQAKQRVIRRASSKDRARRLLHHPKRLCRYKAILCFQHTSYDG